MLIALGFVDGICHCLRPGVLVGSSVRSMSVGSWDSLQKTME